MKLPDGNKKPIKMMDIPEDANLSDHITLEEENDKLRAENKQLKHIRNLIECYLIARDTQTVEIANKALAELGNILFEEEEMAWDEED